MSDMTMLAVRVPKNILHLYLLTVIVWGSWLNFSFCRDHGTILCKQHFHRRWLWSPSVAVATFVCERIWACHSPSLTLYYKSTNKYFGILQVDWIGVPVTVSQFLIFTFALSIVLLKIHPRKLNSIAQLYLMRPKSEMKNERPPIVCS